MSKMKRKVLIIAFGFPPMAGSGIQRVVQMVKSLPLSGWDPIVLTVPRWGNEISDESWITEIPDSVRIHRVFSLDPFRLLMALRGSRFGPSSRKAKPSARQADSGGIISKMKNLYHSISIPDNSIWWVPLAVIYGLYLCMKHRPRLILSTSGPYGDALVGLCLHKMTAIKWISEFRDPWTLHPFRIHSGIRGNIESAMEKSCLGAADGVIATTEHTLEEYRARNKSSNKCLYTCITNGYDPDLFADSSVISQSSKFHIVYTGLFYGERSPKFFFRALRRADKINPDFTENSSVTIAGSVPDTYRRELSEYPLKELVNVLGYVSHKESIELLKSAHCLYLFLSKKEPGIYPAKLFEYLAARRLILANIPADGITADIIRRFQAGEIAGSEDSDKLCSYILESYERHNDGSLVAEHSLDDIVEFSWPFLAKKRAGFLEEISGGIQNER